MRVEQIERLDRSHILERLEPVVSTALASLDVLTVTGSTNEVVRAGSPAPPGHMNVTLAEYQTGGRGRRGRRWLSPFGSGVCMSAGWTFPVMPPNLPALSLAAGLAVLRALKVWNPVNLGLKWPNDIVAGGEKLGGLLIDVQGGADGPIAVVVGIGINIDVEPDFVRRFDGDNSLRPVGLRSLVRDSAVSRNEVAAGIINALFHVLVQFESSGFREFADEWRDHDAMQGALIQLRAGDHVETGVAVGIGDDGALLFNDGDRTRSVLSGDVTLRPAAAEEIS